MKYLIVGAGGTGGVVGYYMTKAGKDVTLIARGAHLKQMQTKGLTLEKMWDQSTETIPVKASDMEHYTEQPDVILVCVKGYSLEDTIPFIQKVAKKDTVVIPILNPAVGRCVDGRSSGRNPTRRSVCPKKIFT